MHRRERERRNVITETAAIAWHTGESKARAWRKIEQNHERRERGVRARAVPSPTVEEVGEELDDLGDTRGAAYEDDVVHLVL